MLYGYKVAAVCVPRIYEEVLLDFINALSDTLRPAGWRVFVYTTGSDMYWKTRADAGEALIFDLIDDRTADALILFKDRILDEETYERLLMQAKQYRLPVIVVGALEERCDCNVLFDFAGGFASIVRHLLDHHKVRSFHFIAGMKGNPFSEERLAIMQRLLGERGIPFDESCVSYGDFWSVPARQAVERLIDEDRVPRAIVCANDVMAISVSSVLIRNGWRVPQDVIVTGFDGIDPIQYSVPRISSCFCDYTLLGLRIAGHVLRLGDNVPLPARDSILPSLILSESCGCRPRTEFDCADYINRMADDFSLFRNEEVKLSEISTKILTSRNIREVAGKVRHRLFFTMCIMLKTECIDEALDPLVQHSEDTFGDRLFILSDTDVPYPPEEAMLPREELVPRLESLLDFGMPLIFIALNYIDVPLGYLCFHYEHLDRSNCLKIGQMAMSLSTAIGGYRITRYQAHLQQVVADLYRIDALTGMYTRRAFLLSYAQLAAKHEPLTLVLADLDGLKYINDHFSHSEGDTAISAAAAALRDACGGGLTCRYGGDELVCVIEGEQDAAAIHDRILAELSRYNQDSGKPYKVDVSIGIHTAQGMEFEALFALADEKMYAEKQHKPHTR
ncbi:MAG: GGDEF domain-containing protein [Oscillospiraceae bacterium]|nr:GGDEF domain-containing protein [Oscillospiraceae bacterium]